MTVSDDDKLHLTTLGSLSLRDPDGNVLSAESKPLLILAFLAAQPDRRAPRDYVAALVWPDADAKHRKRSLRQALHILRKIGAEGAVSTEGSELALDAHLVSADLWEIGALVQQEAYDEAIELVGGPFLDSVRSKTSPELARWAEAEDARLEVVVDQAFRFAIERHLEAGARDRAVSTCRRWVHLNPLVERRVRTLIEALLDEGSTVEAVQEAKRFRTLIEAELDETPSTAFLDLQGRAEARLPVPRGLGSGVAPAIDGGATNQESSGWARSGPAALDILVQPPLWVLLGLAVLVVGGGLGVLAGMGSASAISVVAGDGAVVGRLAITPSSVTFRPDDDLPVRGTLRSPVGPEVARGASTLDGIDLEVVDARGQRLFALESSADELPLDWSPDGARLLYRRGWYDRDQNRYRVALGTWDRASGETHEFEIEGFDGQIGADWSPDGSQIAIGGGPRLLLATPGGTILAETEAHGHVGRPRWSPSGGRLAVSVWDGTPADIHVLDPGTPRLTPLVETLGHERELVWLNDRYLLTISELEDRRDLVLVDAVNAAATLIGEDVPASWLGAASGPVDVGPVEEIYRAHAGASDARFVDSLHVEGPSRPLGVGEYVFHEVSPIGPDGATIVDLPRAPVWTLHTGRLDPLRPGPFRAVAPGSETVSVSYPGWRTTSFSVDISQPQRRALPPVWQESWDSGWTARRIPGRIGTGFAFEARGDESYASGTMTRSGFATEAGMTSGVLGSGGVHAGLFQHGGVGLSQRPPDLSIPHDWNHVDAEAWLWLVSEDQKVLMAGMDHRYRLPLPDSTDVWRRYALQVSASGAQILFVDGNVHART